MAKGKKSFKEKKIIIFDEDLRKDYLLGFRKRKNQRRQKAMDDLKKKEKEKIRELKKKKREEFMEHLRKQRQELDALESEEEDEPEDHSTSVDTTYDHPEQVVTVTTVCDLDLEEDSTIIGHNKGNQEIDSNPDMNRVNKEETKTKVFEKKIKKYNKNQNTQRKRSKDNNSSKFHPKKKRKKNAHIVK
ncbi:nucleolar protein 12-like [Actinia tenebrosa]|uniref:Nucleolar protein 12 n=1 Tax=Actinia tenebrosa TaxID=6105 RepID=A0A6P8HFR3_ACTTE|nr:nucleolar protein 12-like [Actinia tenebrosa]